LPPCLKLFLSIFVTNVSGIVLLIVFEKFIISMEKYYWVLWSWSWNHIFTPSRHHSPFCLNFIMECIASLSCPYCRVLSLPPSHSRFCFLIINFVVPILCDFFPFYFSYYIFCLNEQWTSMFLTLIFFLYLIFSEVLFLLIQRSKSLLILQNLNNCIQLGSVFYNFIISETDLPF
jgi:hypothetical protein